MAKIVIAGAADCPYYAKVELLADTLVQNLDNFKLHKIVKQPSQWKTWLDSTCKERGWSHAKSPIVWRELVDRGGKGMLIGGANEFQEYTKAYYDVESAFTSDDMRKIATENMATKQETDDERRLRWEMSKPVHICLTCGTSSAAYSMIAGIAQGEGLGPDTEVVLHLYDDTDKQEVLQGVAMEAFDLSCTLLKAVHASDDLVQCLSQCSAIIFLDNLVQDDEEETKEAYFERNYELFSNYGKVINEAANKDVKVLVAGNGPVNFNAWTVIHNAPDIPRSNIVALSRLVENTAKGILSQRLKVNSAGLADIVVWGNINGMNYIDVQQGQVFDYDGAIWGPPAFSRSAVEMVHDNKWLSTEFLEAVSQRRSLLEPMLKHAASGSLGAAVVSLLNHWSNGSPEGQMFSLGVYSEGWYDLPTDIVFSLPVTFNSKGHWVIVPDLELSDEIKAKLQDIAKELIAEKDIIFGPPKEPTPPPEVYDSEEEAEVATETEKAEEEAAEKPAEQAAEGEQEAEPPGEQADKVADDAEVPADDAIPTDAEAPKEEADGATQAEVPADVEE